MNWTFITGSLRRTLRVEWLALWFLVATQVAPAVAQDQGATPDMEFLEFLGSWELRDGQSVDPLLLDELSVLDEPGVETIEEQDKPRQPTDGNVSDEESNYPSRRRKASVGEREDG